MHRSRLPILLFALPFIASDLGAYAWFNTDIVRLTSESLNR